MTHGTMADELVTVTINGRSYLLHSEESIVDPTAKGCVPARLNPLAGASQPWLTDITDERHPVDASQFRLEINEPLNCGAQATPGPGHRLNTD